MSRYWHRLRRFLAQKVLHTDDTPHAVALGAALGMFVGLLPLIGIQMIVVVGVATLFRANKAIGIPIVWITNPFTAVPIYGGCFVLGRAVMATPAVLDHATFLSMLKQMDRGSLLAPAFWGQILQQLAGLGLELWIGCALVGAVAALATYVFARWGVTMYREQSRQKLLRRRLLRATLKPGHIVRRSEPA